MEMNIKLKRGLDLSLDGALPEGPRTNHPKITRVAVTPDDFPGLQPRMLVKEGQAVAAGTPLICSKHDEAVCLCSPAAGTIEKIERGERRKIIRVVISLTDANVPAVKTTVDPTDAKSIKEALLASGLWAAMRQRPYDIVPRTDATPRDIFVTAFDSAPLAPSLEQFAQGKQAEIAAAVAALSKLTPGNVYISTRTATTLSIPAPAIHVTFEGPHPAGNAGIQAANIAPVNKGETIWTLDLETLVRIGELMTTGTVDRSTVVAITGSEVVTPCLAVCPDGAEVAPLLEGNIKDDHHHHRIISGNVLTGETVAADGYLRFPYRQITVIPEGDDVDEFMGWASMKPSKLSISRTFPLSALRKRFAPDARLLGGRRAMIMSGLYDKVLPMDILPEYLLKAINARDIDRMEQLGIYEVAPEDFALCEFVDPSKIEIQKLVRDGLDYLRKELE